MFYLRVAPILSLVLSLSLGLSSAGASDPSTLAPISGMSNTPTEEVYHESATGTVIWVTPSQLPAGRLEVQEEPGQEDSEITATSAPTPFYGELMPDGTVRVGHEPPKESTEPE